jgi:hypothetical protein
MLLQSLNNYQFFNFGMFNLIGQLSIKVNVVLWKRMIILTFSFLLLASTFQSIIRAQTSEPYQWKNVIIGGGGFVPGIITSPATKDLMYARTDVGGAYRWNAADTSWIAINDNISSSDWSLQGIESVALDPSDSNRVYIAAGMYTNGWSPIKGAMLRSSDKGITWQRTNLTIDNGGNEDGRNCGERLVVDPNKDSILFFGSRRNGLWKSTNRSVNWSIVSTYPINTTDNFVGTTFVVFDKNSGTPGNATPFIYAGVARTGNSNLYFSADSGTTWQAVAGQPTNLMPLHGVLDSDSMLFLSYGDAPGPNGLTSGAVWKYNTHTGTWTNINPPTGLYGFGGISVDASNHNILLVATLDRWWPQDEIYRSTDAGASWKNLRDAGAVFYTDEFPWASSLSLHWIGDIEIDPFNSDHAVFTTGYGVWSTFDLTNADLDEPTHWYFTNKGLEECVPLGLISPSYGAHLLSVISDYDGFKHDNLDVSPQDGRFTPNMGTTRGIAYASNVPNLIVRVASEGYYSLNGGATWSRFPAKPSGTMGYAAISADGETIIWSTTDGTPGIAYTRDRGTTWTECAGAPTSLRVEADHVNSDKFYIYDSNTGKVYVSVDGGASFSEKATQSQWGGNLCAVPGKEGDIWLPLASNGLWRSTNSGTGFTKVSGIQSASLVGFGKGAPDQTYPSIYLFGMISGVTGIYRSNDTALTWVRINDNLHQFGGLNIIIGDSRLYGRVYLGTSGRGIIYGMPQTDCDSVLNGSAFIDECDSCVGGNTGLQACIIDCHGDQNGSATIDLCGICVGGNTGKDSCYIDCNGVEDGTAYIDICDVCVGGNTGRTDCTLNTVDVQEKNIFKYSPNPFTNALKLQTSVPTVYAIINILGKPVESGLCQNVCFIGKDMEPGIYILLLRDKKKMKMVKIIKQ